mgnify:CR=1 FL=1
MGCSDDIRKKSQDFYDKYNSLEIRDYENVTIMIRYRYPVPYGTFLYEDENVKYGALIKFANGNYYFREHKLGSTDDKWKILSKNCELVKRIPLDYNKVVTIFKIFKESEELNLFYSFSPCIHTFKFDEYYIEIVKEDTDSCMSFIEKKYNRIAGSWFYDS